MRIGAAVALGCLLCAGVAQASVFTVGPGGGYATLQAALNAATAATGDNEVRVRAGAYAERVSTGALLTAGKSVTVTGGWDASFSSRQADPATTVIDGGGLGRVFDLAPAGGTLVIDGFTIRNGHHALFGGGVHGDIVESGTLILQNNVVELSSSEDGGGVYVGGNGTASIVVTNNLIRDNEATARAGGLSVRALGDATFSVTHNDIEGNRIECCSLGSGSGTGVFVKLQERPVVDFSDNLIRGNESSGAKPIQGDGGALWLFVGCGGLDCTNATLTARRNRWIDNTSTNTGGLRDHVSLRAESGDGLPATLAFTDSIVSGGSGVGVGFLALETSTLHMTNLTVVDHPGTGILQRGVHAGAAATLYNTIAFGNAPDVTAASALTGSNLVGVDPSFVDAAAGDLGVEEGSLAIDAGDNAAPGGLGPFDVEGAARIADGTVNVGAVERVPEPALLWLQAGALLVLGGVSRRRARRAGAAAALRTGRP
jgi:hypothetical protein